MEMDLEGRELVHAGEEQGEIRVHRRDVWDKEETGRFCVESR